jgi:hypothetical protein
MRPVVDHPMTVDGEAGALDERLDFLGRPVAQAP